MRPYGGGLGEADDHLRVDLGWSVTVPHGTAGERARREDGVDMGAAGTSKTATV